MINERNMAFFVHYVWKITIQFIFRSKTNSVDYYAQKDGEVETYRVSCAYLQEKSEKCIVCL